MIQLLRPTLLIIGLLLSNAMFAQEADVAALEEAAMSAAVAQVGPSVVRVETFGGLQRIGQVLLPDGPTTGLVISQDGFILSSAFNFVRKPNSILVTLPDGKRAPAKIVARDHSRMLVLLKVEHDNPLAVFEMAQIDQMQVGQWAIAVGRTFDPKRANMSIGVVSAKDRIWGKAIQTDAKISPSNYGGPLVDIRGRVLGILVPMSPNGNSEMAGVEWYDSGIGFAVPIAEIQPQLDLMKQGKDVHPGLMGITMKGGSIYSKPAEIAACQVRSPAFEAGLRPGDLVIEIDGQNIARQAQLKHALGPKYAGETIHVVVMRDDERIEVDIELVAELVPYEHPFLGILPRRDHEGIVVRYVYSDSNASEAGLQSGDRILTIDEKALDDTDALRLAIANFEPQQKITIGFERGDVKQTAELTLTTLPASLPDSLPAPRDKQPPAGDFPKPKFIEIKIAEEPNDCLAFVPPSYDAAVPHGVLIYLRAPGDFDQERLLVQWQQRCIDNDLILLAPQPRDRARWTPTELEFIRKTLDHVLLNYTVDPTRIALFGKQAGGALAYLFAFRHRDHARAVIAVDAALPIRFRPPDNDPVQRLAIITTVAKNSRLAERVEQGVDMLREMKYPVSVLEMDAARQLSQIELDSIIRWVDSLDRI